MVFVGDERQFWELVWPDVDGVVVDSVEVAGDTATIDVHAGQRAVTCPSCGVSASRIHSGYKRRLADRPIGGRRVVLRLRVRRFFCDNAACDRPGSFDRAGGGLAEVLHRSRQMILMPG